MALPSLAGASVGGELPPSLLKQREDMPEEFREHLFGTPLTVRVELDGHYLGDAEILLDAQDRFQILRFGETDGSTLSAAARDQWAQALAEPMALGRCEQQCRGLNAAHFSLDNSLLNLLTPNAGVSEEGSHFVLPEGGSHGLVLRNSVAVYAQQGQATNARYSAELSGSIGYWSAVGNYQYYTQAGESQHYLSALYAQREYADHFVRAGYFLPNFEGVIRQPTAPNGQYDTALGIMAGSSDVLLADTGTPSVYPVYVTASRNGVVEILRDGNLLATQAVRPGMQEVDTRQLPGGIYDVVLRVIEDGQTTSTEVVTIHKSTAWRDPSRRWRYSVFAGAPRNLVNSDQPGRSGGIAAGAVVNYLAHPRAVLGATVKQVGQHRAAGVSMNWEASDRFNLYTNFYTSRDAGRGADLQAMYRYAKGSIMANHARTWVEQTQWEWSDQGRPRWTTRGDWQDSTSLSFTHSFGQRDHASLRLARTSGFNPGTGIDVSFSRRETLFGRHSLNWRVSAYDRPGDRLAPRYRRQRGIDLSVSLSLGGNDRSYGASVGSRTGYAGNRDAYASASVNQQFRNNLLRNLNGSVTLEREGLGLGTGATLEHELLRGQVQLQRSAWGGMLSGNATLNSTLVLGGGKVAWSGRSDFAGNDTGVIVDVRSDYPDVELRADDSNGGGVALRPGRNFMPLTAYQAGNVQFDFEGALAPAATIQPATLRYHLNRGGVMHATVDVMRTFTVMGQVLDAQGKGVRGVHVINHAGRSMSQDEGFFTLELSARTPVVELQYPNQVRCVVTMDESRYPREGNMLMVGGLQCPPQVVGR